MRKGVAVESVVLLVSLLLAVQVPVLAVAGAAQVQVAVTEDGDNSANLSIDGDMGVTASFSEGSQDGTIDVRVAASDDDAEEQIDRNSVTLQSSDLELGEAGAPQIVGMRFQNVQIPPGVAIIRAYVEFTADETHTGATYLTFHAQASNDAAAFDSNRGNLTSRPKTAASAAWNDVGPWTTEHDAYQSADLSAIVQEVVNRPGWSAGNALAIFVTGSGRRTAESFNGEPAMAPRLHVEFGGGQTCYTLSTGVDPANGGAVDSNPPPNCGSNQYVEGTVVQLTANANAGYTFANWSGDLAGSTNPDTVTMDAEHSVIAHFSDVAPIPTDSNLKVAFIGDSGAGDGFSAVLELIKNEGADMVLHQGDFGLGDGPDDWAQAISEHLSDSFPFFGSVGNHDIEENHWRDYQSILQSHLDKTPGASCDGELAVKSYCTYRGLSFVLSGVGTKGSGHASFINDRFQNDDHVWKICSWHKNMTAMQLGSKGNTTGWEVYETCLNAGAIVATAHEHSYHRTRTLTSAQNQEVDLSCEDNPDTPDTDVCVAPGKTFVFVSGAGGAGIRNQERCLPSTYPYGCRQEWAKVYTTDQDPNATHGALFITFNVNGNPYQAEGYFKNVNG